MPFHHLIRNSWATLPRFYYFIYTLGIVFSLLAFLYWTQFDKSWHLEESSVLPDRYAFRGKCFTCTLHSSFSPTCLRYFLNYHTPHQIIWGLIAGVVFGAVYFGATEYIPDVYPLSILGRARRSILQSTPFTWCRIKDGWAVWKDGGHEAEYQRWRNLWDAQNTKKS